MVRLAAASTLLVAPILTAKSNPQFPGLPPARVGDNLVVTEPVYAGYPSLIVPGTTMLPTGVFAIADGGYPEVFKQCDGGFELWHYRTDLSSGIYVADEGDGTLTDQMLHRRVIFSCLLELKITVGRHGGRPSQRTIFAGQCTKSVTGIAALRSKWAAGKARRRSISEWIRD